MKLNKRSKRPNFLIPEILLQELPKPLHGITPRFIMGGKMWNKKKNAAALKNNYCCWVCGVNVNDTEPKRLEGAPVFFVVEETKRVIFRDVAALCKKCNSFLNLSILWKMEKRGLCKKELIEQIILHGDNFVDVVKKIENINVMFAVNDFKNWRYFFDGIEYYSRFDSLEEYNAFFNAKEVIKNGY